MRSELINSFATKINAAREAGDRAKFNQVIETTRYALLDLEESKLLAELTNNLKWSVDNGR